MLPLFMFFKNVSLACWQSAHRSHPSQHCFSLTLVVYTFQRERTGFQAWPGERMAGRVSKGRRGALAGFGTGISTALPHSTVSRPHSQGVLIWVPCFSTLSSLFSKKSKSSKHILHSSLEYLFLTGQSLNSVVKYFWKMQNSIIDCWFIFPIAVLVFVYFKVFFCYALSLIYLKKPVPITILNVQLV